MRCCADVAVYVLDSASSGSALEHLVVQVSETLHAVLVLGPVCDGTLR